MKQAVSVRESSEVSHSPLRLIEARHREIEDRLKELGRRAYLTPPEQREILALKKQKLRAKDELTALRRGD